MKLILVVIVVACLQDVSDGFVSIPLKGSAARCSIYNRGTLSASHYVDLSAHENIVSNVVCSVENGAVYSHQRNRKSLFIQKVAFAFRSAFNSITTKRNDKISNGNNLSTSHNLRSETTVDKINESLKKMKQKVLVEKFRILPLFIMVNVLSLLKLRPCVASGGITGPVPKSNFTPFQGACIWGCLFVLSATLHSAESAITKISPWKVLEFAEEEGPESPFATLSANLTRLLSTILLMTTACSIYSTALFVATATEYFPSASLGLITAVLTAFTLFFGELLPKALAVSNSELVARKMVPALSRLSTLLLPITSVVTFLSDRVLLIAGMRSKEDKNVSEDMLRLVVEEAQRSSTGIDTGEGRMIKAVLDMQDTEVSKIMQPRVDIVGVPESATATQILQIVVENRYSRVPVYRGDVDHIVGVVYSKDLLEVFGRGLMSDDHDYAAPTPVTSMTVKGFKPAAPPARTRPPFVEASDSWESLTAVQIMEPTYFIPETMTTWTALQEMRKRRLHLAIVVDEYGGTAGLVTFEDILEEVVGEIYDEDDTEEYAVDSRDISRDADGTFLMMGVAELDNVCEALGLQLTEEDMEAHSTIGGYVCAQAGEIPSSGETIVFSGYRFTVIDVEDNRRIISIKAEKYGEEPKELDGNGRDRDRDRDGGRREDSREGDDVLALDSLNAMPGGMLQEETDMVFRDGEWMER